MRSNAYFNPAGIVAEASGSDPFGNFGGLDLFSGLSLTPQEPPEQQPPGDSPLSTTPLEAAVGSGSFLSGVEDHQDLLAGLDSPPVVPSVALGVDAGPVAVQEGDALTPLERIVLP